MLDIVYEQDGVLSNAADLSRFLTRSGAIGGQKISVFGIRLSDLDQEYSSNFEVKMSQLGYYAVEFLSHGATLISKIGINTYVVATYAKLPSHPSFLEHQLAAAIECRGCEDARGNGLAVSCTHPFLFPKTSRKKISFDRLVNVIESRIQARKAESGFSAGLIADR